jgi:hypothetical protein
MSLPPLFRLSAILKPRLFSKRQCLNEFQPGRLDLLQQKIARLLVQTSVLLLFGQIPLRAPTTTITATTKFCVLMTPLRTPRLIQPLPPQPQPPLFHLVKPHHPTSSPTHRPTSHRAYLHSQPLLSFQAAQPAVAHPPPSHSALILKSRPTTKTPGSPSARHAKTALPPSAAFTPLSMQYDAACTHRAD